MDLDQSRCFCYYMWSIAQALCELSGMPQSIINGIFAYYAPGLLKAFKTPCGVVDFQEVANSLLQGDVFALLLCNLFQQFGTA